jgi:4-hydroxy-3-polyprenylbenzoate decarboxylase
VEARWAELGLADLGGSDPDPALFGYSFERVLERLAAGAGRPR